MTITQTWWKDATVYQIWPASYKDSNGDGVGDIRGIISTLDYIKDIGVDVIWLSPMFDSPQDDMGYDISNYEAIYPKYGTMEDMDELIEKCHARGMKLVLDLVINHSSSEHEWFKESRSSKTNPKRDWYIWRPPRIDAEGNRHPPTNWESFFAGSAWQYDELTDEYYLHLFAKTQPDFNWENEEARKAIYQTSVTFWLDKGIDGFRIDTSGLYSKVYPLRDAPVADPTREFQDCNPLTHNGPRIHEFHKELSLVMRPYDAMTVGEACIATPEDMLRFVSAKEKEMSMVFVFNVVLLGVSRERRFALKPFTLPELKEATRAQCELVPETDGWATAFIENHDQPRCITRFGSSNPKYLAKSGKLIAMMEAALSGTLFLYQGQEIGMTNFSADWPISEYKDLDSINHYNEVKEKHGEDSAEVKALMHNLTVLARDHARTPVQWDDSPNAGFTSGTPWMRVNDNYKTINVKSQVNDPNSVLSFYKQALQVRKAHKEVLIHGAFEVLDKENLDVFTFTKKNSTSTIKVVLNFSDEEQPVEASGQLLLSNSDSVAPAVLSPWEGRIYLQ